MDSLTQHLYKHKKLTNQYVCKCGVTFPFQSQLRIHRAKTHQEIEHFMH